MIYCIAGVGILWSHPACQYILSGSLWLLELVLLTTCESNTSVGI